MTAKIYLMRLKKLAFVHEWRRNRKSGSDSSSKEKAQSKRAGVLEGITAEVFTIHECSPAIEVAYKALEISDKPVSKAEVLLTITPVAPVETSLKLENLPSQLMNNLLESEESEPNGPSTITEIHEDSEIAIREVSKALVPVQSTLPLEQNASVIQGTFAMESPKGKRMEFASIGMKLHPKETIINNIKTIFPTEKKVFKTFLPDVGDSIESELLLRKIRAKKLVLRGTPITSTVIRDERIRQKQEIANLNDFFASLIEKVRFYDADNKKIAFDLQMLRGFKGPEKLFIKEIAEVHKSNWRIRNERGEQEKQLVKLEAEVAENKKMLNDVLKIHEYERKDIDKLIVRLGEIEQESNLFKRRIHESEDEISQLKKTNTACDNLLKSTQRDIAKERLTKMEQDNEANALHEEISLLRHEQTQEIQDLQESLIRCTASSEREHFRNVFAKAIHQVRQEHEERMAADLTELDFWYKVKLQEIQLGLERQTTSRKNVFKEFESLRKQMTDLRSRSGDYETKNLHLLHEISRLQDEIQSEQQNYEVVLGDRDASIMSLYEEYDALVSELRYLSETKLTLEQEIAKYRNLLDKTDSVYRSRLTSEANLITTEVEDSRFNEFGETTNKITFQETAKGNVIIKDIATDGRYVMLENTNLLKEELIGGWKLYRTVANGPNTVFTFPANFVLKPRNTVKIWAKDRGGFNNPPEHLIFNDINTFGIGDQAKTILLNPKGEERAVHTQQTQQTTIIYK